MSGENQRDDDPDFLDDDFILEDVAAKNEELDQLFETPSLEGDGHGRATATDPDAEDVLFTAPEKELEPDAMFAPGPAFAESGESTWSGEGLELESGRPVGSAPGVPKAMDAAEATFAKELGSLLSGEEDFALDSEQDLEVIGAASSEATDGISEFEQSGPFVIDEGEGTWQDAGEEGLSTTDEESLGVPVEAALAAEDEQAPVEPGWEPLPAASVDDLAEVGEVAPADADGELVEPASGFDADAAGAVAPRPALVGAGAGAEVDGHDIYAPHEEAAEVVGAAVQGRSTLRWVASLAASLAVLAAGAVAFLRPEWIGWRAEPERVQQAEVKRPAVAVAVPTPEPVVAPTAATPSVVQTQAPVPPAVEPVTPPQVAVESRDPVVAPPVVSPVVETSPTAVVPAPSPATPANTWPAPEAAPPSAAVVAGGGGKPANLVRVNEELMMGDQEDVPGRPVRAAEGVMPGSRAFAQLINGNYFIGSVKWADAERITLRVDDGEVTLPVAAITRLTELGSSDYEELQKVTSGFVRLTNNNRLVGGILSGIADDHVVLEFRSNRVMLPKSAIGQVVQGDGDAAVRLDTTREEDDWLRRLVERQLGTGAPPPPAPAPPPTGRTPR